MVIKQYVLVKEKLNIQFWEAIEKTNRWVGDPGKASPFSLPQKYVSELYWWQRGGKTLQTRGRTLHWQWSWLYVQTVCCGNLHCRLESDYLHSSPGSASDLSDVEQLIFFFCLSFLTSQMRVTIILL